jgi:hypothetical protein
MSGVPAQVGDLFEAHAVVGEQGHEAVPQFAGCPFSGVESGRFDDRPEGSQHIVPVELGAGLAGENDCVTGG